VLQHVDSVSALLSRHMAGSGNAERRVAAQVARRAVVERPVVYYTDVDEATANHLRGSALAADMQRLTGLRVERRAEGVLLVDTVAFSSERFPGTGSVAQAAVLLAVEMAERVADPDGRRARRMPAPHPRERQDALVAEVDAGLPTATLMPMADDQPPSPEVDADGDDEPGRLPFITDTFLRTAVADILRRYGSGFGAQWHADPDRLRAEAVALLERFGTVTAVPGGVLVRPLVGRYRNTVAAVKRRAEQPTIL
jgi:hypothetical protein